MEYTDHHSHYLAFCLSFSKPCRHYDTHGMKRSCIYISCWLSWRSLPFGTIWKAFISSVYFLELLSYGDSRYDIYVFLAVRPIHITTLAYY